MADFRRVVLALAVLALLTGFAVTASAQQVPAFACSAAVAVPPLLRAEGVTELVGDIVLNCSGGTELTAPPIPTANFQVFVGNTTVTSRLLSNQSSEAVLLIDEPLKANQTIGTNVFQGVVATNSVTFFGVPVNPPGTTKTRIFRISNVRVNASAIGAGAGFSGSQVLAFVSISGSTSIPVNSPQVTVGFVQPGLSTQIRKFDSSDTTGGLSLNQCDTVKTDSNTGRTLRYTEGFGTAFKPQGTVGGQPVLAFIYNTESGLTTALGDGQANFGTRLRATFRNIPTGVSVYVSTTSQAIKDQSATAVLLTSEIAPNTAVNAPFPQAKTSTINGVDVFQLTLDATGSASAAWEVTKSDPTIIDSLDFKVFFAFSANPAANVPPAGVQGTVSQSFAPTGTGSTWTSASSSLTIPRFVDLSTPKNIIITNICRTTLLYPFVTAANGFDTGLAIANTSDDGGISDASPQAGTCTLNFFGDNAPSAFTTPSSVAAGKVYANVASAVAPGFQGYVIARCNFQYAHGFAFVQSTVGYTPSTAAMGYLALVLQNTRGLPGAESLTH